MGYDIGLVRLDDPVTSLIPMTLNTDVLLPQPRYHMWATGCRRWSSTRKTSGRRRTVDVPFYKYDSQFVYMMGLETVIFVPEILVVRHCVLVTMGIGKL